jgi:hypothetical protein
MYKRDATLIELLKQIFCKQQQELFNGQVGIYHYIVAIDTIHEDSHGKKYDIYAKVKIIEIYKDLVEVECVDFKLNDSASQDVINIIKNNFPKYVNPKYVKWQLKKEQTSQQSTPESVK